MAEDNRRFKKYASMTEAAQTLLDPYESDPRVRRLAASAFVVPLLYLHRQPPEKRDDLIREYASHLSPFLDVLESDSETLSIKRQILEVCFAQGISNIAASAYSQDLKAKSGRSLGESFNDPAASIRNIVDNNIDFENLITRVIRFACNPRENSYLRLDAINIADRIDLQAINQFGQTMDREKLYNEFLNVAFSSPDQMLVTRAETLAQPRPWESTVMGDRSSAQPRRDIP